MERIVSLIVDARQDRLTKKNSEFDVNEGKIGRYRERKIEPRCSPSWGAWSCDGLADTRPLCFLLWFKRVCDKVDLGSAEDSSEYLTMRKRVNTWQPAGTRRNRRKRSRKNVRRRASKKFKTKLEIFILTSSFISFTRYPFRHCHRHRICCSVFLCCSSVRSRSLSWSPALSILFTTIGFALSLSICMPPLFVPSLSLSLSLFDLSFLISHFVL